MIRLSIIFILFFVGVSILSIQNTRANFYASIGGSLSKTNDLEITNNGKYQIYKDFSIHSTATQEEEICLHCPFDTNGVPRASVMNNSTKNETINYSEQGVKIKPSFNKDYTLAIGYNFFNHIRIEGEFRTSSVKKQLDDLLTDFNINSSINIANNYYCKSGEYDFATENDIRTCNSVYKALNSKKDYSSSSSRSNMGLFGLVSNNGDKTYISFSNKINYFFMNSFYDVPLNKYFGIFTGGGIGLANINLKTDTNLALNLNGTSLYIAYQYRFGSYYQFTNNFRLALAITHISSIGKIKFNNFLIKSVSQDSADFSLMYLL